MKLIPEPLPDLKVLEPFIHRDPQGDFVNSFHETLLSEHGICLDVKEEFFSTSAKGVLRGMHFQLPPHSHQKLLCCIAGAVFHAVLDLRAGSSTYGKSAGVEISAQNHHLIFIPRGFAHGFLSLEDQSCLVYKTDAVHAPSHDSGILWSSFGFDWPEKNPQLSQRDQSFSSLQVLASPFRA
jgi:dTDP-4-dehydrorhamnose 3,5-epimerase